MQISLPCAVFAQGPSELCLKGGTNAEMAPQIDYTMKVCVDVYLHNGQDRTGHPSNSVHFIAIMFQSLLGLQTNRGEIRSSV